MMETKKFNENFLIGASTAAHQVEGNNTNSDFWVMEQLPGTVYKDPSLDAVDHYNRYEEDIKLMAEAGLNAYRFSIEWARIEPSKGNFDKKEIEHYRDVLKCCHEHGITPVVTLHHFSSPIWLISAGGWEQESTIGHFEEYTRYVVSELGDLIPYICTINEANMGIQITRIMEKYKRQAEMAQKVDLKKSEVQTGLNIQSQSSMAQYFMACGEAFGIDPRDVQVFLASRTDKGNKIIMTCHEKARRIIKELKPEIQVGITLSLYDYQTIPGGESYVKKLEEEDFLQYLPSIQEDDFFGLQNYTRKIYGPEGIIDPSEGTRMTDMGNEYYPEALEGVIRSVANHWKKPILVTENGVASTNDKDRVEFIEKAIEGIQQCMAEGIDVRGYLHWSLLDNFEWQKGYEPKFGLIAVDRTTQTRYPKESLKVLGSYSSK